MDTNTEYRTLIKRGIDEVADLLPHQGPIEVFVHHNTLCNWEQLHFIDAVEKVAIEKGARPYLEHNEFLKLHKQGRITEDDLSKSLEDFLDENPEWDKYRDIIWELLFIDKQPINTEHLKFKAKELKNREYDIEQIHRITNSIKTDIPESTTPLSVDNSIESELIQILSSFYDRGISYWQFPNREKGLLKAFLDLYDDLLAGELLEAVKDTSRKNGDTFDILECILLKLNVPSHKLKDLFRSEALALAGWAGGVTTLDNSSQTSQEKLAQYLAVRLLLKKIRNSNESALILNSIPKNNHSEFWGTASLTWEVIRLSDRLIARADKTNLLELAQICISFSDFTRRRIWHLAFEQGYYNDTIGAIEDNIRNTTSSQEPKSCYAAMFCIDDREESLRRHLEELEPKCLTYGFAGFYAVDMLYKGANEHNYAPLCPAPVTPTVKVIEEHTSVSRFSIWLKRLVNNSRFLSHHGSRGLVFGVPVVSLFGTLGFIPVALRFLAPKLSLRIFKLMKKIAGNDRIDTRLLVESFDTGSESGGFSVDEMAQRVFQVLKTIGLTKNFPPIVAVIGHGSSSMNNPHASAYDCGACRGKRGGPNGRAFAQMANTEEVRKQVLTMGIFIPKETHFVGGFHNTCSDEVDFFDIKKIPEKLVTLFEKMRTDFELSCANNAHERCRRFEISANHNPTASLAHVTARSWDLREPRSEYGHSTNALCVIGPRELTRNLFLDRRAFLCSYDHRVDSTGNILADLMSAAVPVCAGINLEYYFSCVDNEIYGSGTKLPHNVTGLVGVMNGFESDLRTGLPWQMVEIHEPIRILFIIEAKLDHLKSIIGDNQQINRLVENEWIKLVWKDPTNNAFHMYRSGSFVKCPEHMFKTNLQESSFEIYSRKTNLIKPVRISRSMIHA